MSSKKSKPPGWALPASAARPIAVNSAITRAREALLHTLERLAGHPGRVRLGLCDPFEVTVPDHEGGPDATRTVHASAIFFDDDSLAALVVATGPRSYAQLATWLFAVRPEGRGQEYPGHAIWRVDLVPRTEVASSERMRRVGELQLDGRPRVVIAGGEHRRHMDRGLDAVELALLTDVAAAVERALADACFEVTTFAPREELVSIRTDGGWDLRPCPTLTPTELAAVIVSDDEEDPYADDGFDEDGDGAELSGYRWDELDAARCGALGARVSALPIATDRTLVLTAVSRAIPVDSTPGVLTVKLVRELVFCDPGTLAELSHISVERDLEGQSPTEYAADTLDAFVRLVENFVGALPGRLVVEPGDLQQLVHELLVHGRSAPAGAPTVQLVPGSPLAPVAALLHARTNLQQATTERERHSELLSAGTAWLQYAGAHLAGVTDTTLERWVGAGGDGSEDLDATQRDLDDDVDRHWGLAALALISAFEPTEVTQPWLAAQRALVPLDLVPAVEAWAQFVPDLLVRAGEWEYRSLLNGPVASEDFDHDELYEDEEDDGEDGEPEEHAHFVLRLPWRRAFPAIGSVTFPRALAEQLAQQQGADRSPASLRAAAAPWLRAALAAGR